MQDITSYEQANPARTTSFTFVVSGRRDLTFKIQNAPLSAVQLGGAPFPGQSVDLLAPSNKLAYDPMNINFLVSEDLHEWIDIYRWMFDITKKNGFSNDTAELTILNSQNQPVARMVYTGIFPLTLGDIQYTVKGEETVISCYVLLQFDSMDIEVIKTGEKITHG